MIPVADPRAQYLHRQTEIDAALARVLHSGRYVLGREVEAFEHDFAAYLGVTDVVALASGTDALRLALLAADIGPGDEVITVANGPVAAVSAIEQVGARAVLADVEAETCTIDAASLPPLIGPRCRGIIATHLYGLAADVEAIALLARERELTLI